MVQPLLSAITRRRFVSLVGAGSAASLVAACGDNAKWHTNDVSGAFPALDFTMTRASDGKEVTAADYKGKVVLVYFGYTFCPDVCPTTLANAADVLTSLGPDADHIRMLFVTVDPNRDTPAVLADYVKNFGPQVEGLRGTPDQLAALARRYRVVYSVKPAANGQPYEVTHSSAIYVFDMSGASRLIISSLSSAQPDKAGTVADLKRLINEGAPQGFFSRLLHMV